MTSSPGEFCGALVAFLRSLYLIHQNHHWQTNGIPFYGNHLLFERLYQETANQADELAEKTIGLFGVEILNIEKQATLIKAICCQYAGDHYLEQSLKAEKEFVKISTNAYNKLKDSGNLSLGLDDMIMEHCSKAEGRVYLLQQATT